MKVEEKEKAFKLRKTGWTYREILNRIPVSKGSLSYWLRDIELTNNQKRRIYNKNLDIRRKFVEYNDLKRKKAISEKEEAFKTASKEIDSLSKQELKLIGIALYWAEGYKTDMAKSVEFANSDPNMIRLIMRWFREICNVSNGKFRIRIQIHNAGNIDKAIEFWSLNTGVSSKQFTKPYIKISPTSKGKSENLLPYGICHVRISNAKLLARIKGWINGLKVAPWSSSV